MRTVNRTPRQVPTPSSSDIKNYFFNHAEWKGMSDNKNYLLSDQFTFESCDNVYSDADGLLRSRPSLKVKTININGDVELSNIKNVWVFNDIQVFLTDDNELVFVNPNFGDSVQVNLDTDKIKLIVSHRKIFVFAETFLSCYDMDTNTYMNAEDFVYIPKTHVYVNGVESTERELDSQNVLTSSYIISYLYTNSSYIQPDEFIGQTLNVKIGDDEYEITFTEETTRILVGKYAQLKDGVFADKYLLGRFGEQHPFVEVSDTESMLISTCTYQVDPLTQEPNCNWNIYHTTTGKIFTQLPKVYGVIGFPKISKDGNYAFVFKDDGPYVYSLIATTDSGMKYPVWTNLIKSINPQYSMPKLNLHNSKGVTFNQSTVVNGYFLDDASFAFTYGEDLRYSIGDPVYNTLRLFICKDRSIQDQKIITFDSKSSTTLAAHSSNGTELPEGDTYTFSLSRGATTTSTKYAKYQASYSTSNAGKYYYGDDYNKFDALTFEITNFKLTLYSDSESTIPLTKAIFSCTVNLCPATVENSLTIPYPVEVEVNFQHTNNAANARQTIYECSMFKVVAVRSYSGSIIDFTITTTPSVTVNNAPTYGDDDYGHTVMFETGGVQPDGLNVSANYNIHQIMPNVKISYTGAIFIVALDAILEEGRRMTTSIRLGFVYKIGSGTRESMAVNYSNSISGYTIGNSYANALESAPIKSSICMTGSSVIFMSFKYFNLTANYIFTLHTDVATWVYNTSNPCVRHLIATPTVSYLSVNEFSVKASDDGEQILLRDRLYFGINASDLKRDTSGTFASYLIERSEIALLFSCVPVKINKGTVFDGLFLINRANNCLYTNDVPMAENEYLISIEKLMEGESKYLYPENYTELDNYYFSNGKNLYISENISDDEHEFLWYFPEIALQKFNYNITNLHPISDSIVAIFLEHEVQYVTWDSEVSAYRYYKSKMQVGCNKGSDILTTFDNKYVVFPSERGLAAMSYQAFVASEEQAISYISDPIYDMFYAYYNDTTSTNEIKLFKYSFWIFVYKRDSNRGFLYDLRNGSWWPMTLPFVVDKIIMYDNHVYIISSGKMFSLDTNDVNYYDYNGEQSKISWHIMSQKLYLSGLNYYKHIVNITLASIHNYENLTSSQANQEEIYYRLQVRLFRKSVDGNINNPEDYKQFNYDVDLIRTFVQRLNYAKVNEFQYLLSSDGDNTIDIPLSLSSITVKYKIGTQVR